MVRVTCLMSPGAPGVSSLPGVPARGLRTRVTATTCPDGLVMMIFHMQAGSISAAAARSRAACAVTGPIRLSSPGSSHRSARVRHGIVSAALLAALAVPPAALLSDADGVPPGQPGAQPGAAG